MTSIALVFLVNVVTSVLKNYIIPRIGKIGTQITVFILSVLVALYVTYADKIVGLQELVSMIVVIFSLSVTIYETILSYFPFFKKGDSSNGEIDITV